MLDSADQDTIATVDLGAFEAPSPPSGFDFGDAPNSYHTLLASDGPRHGLGSGLFWERVSMRNRTASLARPPAATAAMMA